MNKATKAAMLTAAMALVSQASQAQIAAGDILLGFNGNGASYDYVADLGTASTIGVGGTSVTDLSSSLKWTGSGSLQSVFGSSLNGVSMGLGGGIANNSPVTYITEARSGAGMASLAGSATPGSVTKNIAKGIGQAFNGVGSLSGLTAGGSVTPAVGSADSWTYMVTGLGNPNSVAAYGKNVASTISGLTYEDLYKGTYSGSSEQYSYMGYLTFNAAASSMTFTPSTLIAPVPEPAVSGVIASAGLIALSLFRQFRRKTA